MITNVLEYLEESVKTVPDKIVFSQESKSITYHQLHDHSRRLAMGILKATNNASKKPVVVFVDRNIESLVLFMGVAYSGNFYVPIDKDMPKARISLILETLQPAAAVVYQADIDYAKNMAPGLRSIIYEEAVENSINEDKLDSIRKNTIDLDPVYATFTSGSTGIPKGVITCHRSVIDLTEDLTSTFDFNKKSIFGNQNPFYFDASIKDIYCALKNGATMVVIPKSYFVFPAQLAEYMNTHRINTTLWSAAAIALIANTNAFEINKPRYLKKVMFSGEVMHNKVLNYWRKALPGTMFVNLYGPTEITSVCSYYIADRPFRDYEPLPIGRPFKNTDILLLNADDQLVKGKETGEICVRGTCLALGYYNNPEKTKEAFCQNPLNPHFPETIYRTGDLARYNEKGELMFISRKDNQVKHMGQRIELGEIELLINSLELIDASICFYDQGKSKIVLVYEGKEADRKYIIDGIKEKFPKYMFPNIFIKMEAMPYNINGKIDRTLLQKKYKDGDLK